MLASATTASLFPLITYPQIQRYHQVTDSSARRRPSILSVLNNLRTLSIVIGGGTLFRAFRSGKNVPANHTSLPITPHPGPLREIHGARAEYHEREPFRVPGVPCSCPLLQ